MNKFLKIAGIIIAVIATAGVSAYAYAASRGEAKMLGVVVAAKNAALEVKDQPGVTSTLVVDRVLAPGASWVVVHLDMDGKPGERVGILHVDGGESSNLTVPLDPKVKLTEKLLVALHADRGVAGTFEFDMDKFETSPDKPYFIDGMELAKAIVVREFGVKADEGKAAIEAVDQPGVTDSLLVARAVAPTGAWIVVHLDDNGKPGERVGLLQIPAGETTTVTVPLKAGVALTDKLLVAVHADRGITGTFEFDMMDKVNSQDQPFFVGGKEVAMAVSVK
jgi:hypothetical protein